ncbi:MAG: hypothetical protein P8Z74_06215 [Acidobacteriota bacterium]
MFKNHPIHTTRALGSMATLLVLGLTAGWLYFANLGCIAEQLVDGGEIVLSPGRIELKPNTTQTSNATVTWDNGGLYANWSVDGTGIKGVTSATIDPPKGYGATISVTTGDYDSLYGQPAYSMVGHPEQDLPVTAKFAQPFLSAVAHNDIPVTRKKWLSLAIPDPELELTIPAFAPIVHAESGLLSGLSSVRAIVVGAKAEIKNAPSDWRYEFKFSLSVVARHDARDSTTVFLRPDDMPTQTDARGQSATVKFNDLNLGMNDYFDHTDWGLNADFGWYYFALGVEVNQTNGGNGHYWHQENFRYPFFIGSLD